MAGLIQENQDITPDQIRQSMDIPDDMKEAYLKVVSAGMRAMFSKESNQAAVDTLMRGGGPLAQRLGMAIAGLLGMMVKASNGTIPPQVLIPAGVELLVEAADFLRRSKLEQIDNQVIGDAMDVMVKAVLKAANVDPEQLSGFVQQQAGGAQ